MADVATHDLLVEQRMAEAALDAVARAVASLRELGRRSPSRDLSVAIQYAETAELWALRACGEDAEDS